LQRSTTSSRNGFEEEIEVETLDAEAVVQLEMIADYTRESAVRSVEAESIQGKLLEQATITAYHAQDAVRLLKGIRTLLAIACALLFVTFLARL
jgi:hypothetical protein